MMDEPKLSKEESERLDKIIKENYIKDDKNNLVPVYKFSRLENILNTAYQYVLVGKAAYGNNEQYITVDINMSSLPYEHINLSTLELEQSTVVIELILTLCRHKNKELLDKSNLYDVTSVASVSGNIDDISESLMRNISHSVIDIDTEIKTNSQLLSELEEQIKQKESDVDNENNKRA